MLFQNKMYNLLEPFFFHFRLLIQPGNSCTVVYKTVIKPLQNKKVTHIQVLYLIQHHDSCQEVQQC